MKKIIRITRNTLLVLMAFVLCLITFLLIYYSVQNNQIRKNYNELQQKTNTRIIHSDTMDIAARMPLKLIPVPQKTHIMDGFYQIPENPVFTSHDTLKDDIEGILLRFPEINAAYSNKSGDIVISYIDDLPIEGYRMEILPGNISIEFSDKRGLYYAIVSLRILNHNHNGLLPCAIIEDFPDLAVRGLMLDISRDKIPTPETLRQIVDLVADLKYNHLELYMEGFSFAYPSFRDLWENDETPLTGAEIQDLDAFCRSRYIDLVPNQNSLGHMMAWLATDEYNDLAECPDGYKMMGILEMKSTLDPSDPRSIELISRMTDDLLPNFSSGKFNVNLDEPFELGKGKSKKLVKKYGVGDIYLSYVEKIHKIASDRQKQMQMWGDVVLRHPEIINRLPKDIVLLDWGYEADYPFERNCKIFEQSEMKFMLCPGTSSWTSITGRTNNMLGNIASAARNAVKYNADGILLTDWGDFGHWQYLPVSYAGYVTAGALSWNSKSYKKLPLTSFLNDYVFRDSRQIMGHLALDLGRYIQYEEIPVPNMTTTMLTLQFGLNDRIMTNAIYTKLGNGILEMMNDFAPDMVKTYHERHEARLPFDFAGLFTFLDEKEALLDNVTQNTGNGHLVADEYRNSIRLIRAGALLQYYIENRPAMSRTEKIKQLQNLRSLLDEYLNENHNLWMKRNKPGGYERSIASLQKLLLQIDAELAVLNKSVIPGTLDRVGKMIMTSITTLYLKIV
jgi:hexosaminidase